MVQKNISIYYTIYEVVYISKYKKVYLVEKEKFHEHIFLSN